MYIKVSSVTITIIMYQFFENNTDFDRNLKARHGVMDTLSTYRQVLTDRKRQFQVTLNIFLTKSPKILYMACHCIEIIIVLDPKTNFDSQVGNRF